MLPNMDRESNPKDPSAVRFVILNAPRTGSNYLCTVLDGHPDILCHHEIFNPHVVGVARHSARQEFVLGTVEERNQEPLAFLERVWQTSLGRRCVGFKLCWRQDETVLDAVLADPGVRKIVLKRKNRVKSFVSLLLARQTTEWVLYNDAPPPTARPRIRVEAIELFEHIRYNHQYYQQIESSLQTSGQRSLELFYEDLFTGTGLSSTLSFLDLPPADASALTGQCWKLTPRMLAEVISNFDEVAGALRGTELEPELLSPDF
jgi:LPS sulfotransferase NodH